MSKKNAGSRPPVKHKDKCEVCRGELIHYFMENSGPRHCAKCGRLEIPGRR